MKGGYALELRFTFDIATLHRIERLDADTDGKVTRAEAEKAAPEIADEWPGRRGISESFQSS